MYKVFNLLSGEIYETTSKFKRDEYLDRILLTEKDLIFFLFHEDWYVGHKCELTIRYKSTADTTEEITYRVNKNNISALIEYLEDKEKRGAVIERIW